MIAAAARWERILVLAPVIVIGVGIVLGVIIVMGRAFAQFVRESKRMRWIFLGIVVVVAATVVLTILDVKLPKE